MSCFNISLVFDNSYWKMRINIKIFNMNRFTNLLFISRNYQGKYLTSYQKKISTDKRKVEIFYKETKYPINVIANLSIEKENNLLNETQDIDAGKDIEHNNRTDLIEASRAYLDSNNNFRKLLFYGSENKNIELTKYNCHGCGSNLNCKSVDSPGYIPYEVFLENGENHDIMKNLVCLRCFYLNNNIDPMDISLDKDIYHEIIEKQLKMFESAVIIVLADMTDLPFSIPSDLNLDAFKNYRIILLGNKVDLLGKASKNSSWYEQRLIEAAERRGISRDKIEFVQTISAKSCELMESFIDRLLSPKFTKNEPVFLLGSTNTGKSSLFNRFLKSDLCKTIAKPHIKSVVTSVLPGTTLGLLRFPMTNVSNILLNRRIKAKQMLSKGLINSSVDTKYPLLESSKVLSNDNSVQSFNDLVTYSCNRTKIFSNMYDEHFMRTQYDKSYRFDESKITTNKWFYDSPGLINPDQLTSYFNKEDLDKFYSFENLSIPKIFILKTGLSIIMENLARIDIVEAEEQIYVSVHARLPVEIVDSYDINRYYAENDHFTLYSFKPNLSSQLLNRIRSSDPDFEPGKTLTPIMTPVDMEINTEGFDKSSADVILSSIGWVGVSGREHSVCKIRAWTPAAIGCTLRTPSLIPDSVRRRHRRLAHSREFLVI